VILYGELFLTVIHEGPELLGPEDEEDESAIEKIVTFIGPQSSCIQPFK
jgi:hypothetical protein